MWFHTPSAMAMSWNFATSNTLRSTVRGLGELTRIGRRGIQTTNAVTGARAAITSSALWYAGPPTRREHPLSHQVRRSENTWKNKMWIHIVICCSIRRSRGSVALARSNWLGWRGKRLFSRREIRPGACPQAVLAAQRWSPLKADLKGAFEKKKDSQRQEMETLRHGVM